MPSQGQGQVALVIGASRGIGRQIAIDLAKAGYRVILSSKSTSTAIPTPFPPDPNSPQSTITTVAHEINQAGGEAHALPCDVRDSEAVKSMINSAASLYNRLDVLIYNSGAIWWAPVSDTPFKRFRLMQQVNIEGLYASILASLPWFEKGGWKGRVVVVSPPIYSRFFRGKTSYAVGKVGMSVLVKGLAVDWLREKKDGMGICGIWPASAIQSGATRDVQDLGEMRKPEIFSDAILGMLSEDARTVSGNLYTDEDFLRDVRGVSDFEKYALVPGRVPRRMMPVSFPDLRVAEEDDEGNRVNSLEKRRRQGKI